MVDVKDVPFLRASVLPVVHAHHEGSFTPCGTCFAINNTGLFITALHVVEHGLREPIRALRAVREAEGFPAVLYDSGELHEDGSGNHIGGILPVRFVHLCKSFDIALLQVDTPVHNVTGRRPLIPAQRLGTAPPSVGEACFAFGYRSMTWDRGEKAEQVFAPLSCSWGVVEEVHIPERDSGMLHFPCFRTNLNFPHGMSGGPVLDSRGIVRGVVCSSLPEQDGQHTSYATLAGLAAFIQLTYFDREGTETRGFLWDLMECGAIPAELDIDLFTRNSCRLIWAIGGGIISSTLTSS